MQFQVPQFIEVEDKIVGPLTLKQFLYIAGGAGFAYLSYAYLPGWINPFLIMFFLATGISLAFVKINSKPLIYSVEAFFRFMGSSRLYVWKKEAKKKAVEVAPTVHGEMKVPTLSDSRLKDLAWSLDIHDKRVKNRNTQL